MAAGFRESADGAVWTGIGSSMLPAILPGSRLHLAARDRVDAGARVGDVVCFLNGDERFVAHRVVGISGDGGARRITVAGDSGGYPEPVDVAAIVGVVTRVEHPLLSYDARGAVGRAISRWALRRSMSFRGAVLAAEMLTRLSAKAARVVKAFIEP